MYYIKTHERINQTVKIFHLFMWRHEDKFIGLRMGWKLLLFIFELSLALSLITGGFLSEDKNESAYLIAVGTGISVLVTKLYYILWKREQINGFILEIGTYSVADYDDFINANNKLNNLLKFSSSLYLLVFVCSVALSIFCLPIFHSERILAFNLYFPLDWKNNTIAHWTAYGYISIGIIITFVLILFNSILWYLMMNCAIKYEILGNKFKNIGSAKSTVQNMSDVEMENFYLHELNGLIKTHQTLQKTVSRFKYFFANLFFVKIMTSAIGICGTVYMMAFGGNDRPLTQVAIQFAIMAYTIFDIFVLTYLGNEITVSSDRLSYCLFESNWIEMSQSYKKYIIIVTEVFKRPQELLIAKVYPLNLKTFLTTVNGAYSMFNILRNLK